MNAWQQRLFLSACIIFWFVTGASADTVQWPAAKANAWYADQPWPIGVNYSPASAVNQLEFWQADTFAPDEIDKELGWAAQLGINTVRVYLHDLAWKTDRQGLLDRVDQFLAIADKHGIRPLFVPLDDVWNPYPKAGKQPAPRPGVHNSQWVQSPGRAILENESSWDEEVKPYIQAVIGKFKDDNRVLAWDLYNEPGNLNNDYYRPMEPTNKPELSHKLLTKVFAWARAMDPSQPLTAGVWTGDWWTEPDKLTPLNKLQLEQSDIISFHAYTNIEQTKKMTESLERYGRPIFCTEYLARPMHSTFQDILPYFHSRRVAAYNWGFVAGKTNTIHGWDTWKQADEGEPKVWFHDILRPDGTPYDRAETELIKKLSGQSD